MIRKLTAFLASVMGTYFVGVMFIGQGNLAAVAELGLNVGFSDRLETLMHDLTHMVSIYLPLVAISSIIAFSSGGRHYPSDPKPSPCWLCFSRFCRINRYACHLENGPRAIRRCTNTDDDWAISTRHRRRIWRLSFSFADT